MNASRKKIVIILSVAIMIFGYSLYDFVDKTNTKEHPAPFARAGEWQTEIVVYVSGAVNKPGVFKLSPESRVLDAINVSGGLTSRADVEKINLAQVIKDGQQINVPFKAAPTDSSLSAGNFSKPLINVNTASKSELEKIPGIGPALADRIVDYRNNNGSFRELGELRRVSGIGEAKFNQMKPSITL